MRIKRLHLTAAAVGSEEIEETLYDRREGAANAVGQ